MSSEERKKILQMVADGVISAEEAATLMRTLDEGASEADVQVWEAAAGAGDEQENAPEFEEIKSRARRFAMIPLWIGVFLAVLSAWGMYAVQQSRGMNFWFFCLLLPLFVGILLITLGAAGSDTRWLYINVDRRHADDGPGNITFGFPLPLGFAAWLLRTFGRQIRGIKNTNVDEIIQFLDAAGRSSAPLIINANDNDNGERVQVYIG
jgi:hypothetical protein